MKIKSFAFILLAFAGLLSITIVASCTKDNSEEAKTIKNEDDKTSEQPQDNDNYYVKYEVQNGSQISYANSSERTIAYKDVEKEQNITTSKEWEGTYGPFKKGDKVYLNAMNASTVVSRYNMNARISVSKNKEAFTIKAEKRESTSIRLEYTIDY
jgi:hypothetical protein